MAVAVLKKTLDMLAHTLVRSGTAILPLLVTAAAELGFSVLAPLLGSASSLAAPSETEAGPSWTCPAWLSSESAVTSGTCVSCNRRPCADHALQNSCDQVHMLQVQLT